MRSACRSSQAIIITYIVAWALLHERGYQAKSVVESSVITKVKGTTSSNLVEGDGSEIRYDNCLFPVEHDNPLHITESGTRQTMLFPQQKMVLSSSQLMFSLLRTKLRWENGILLINCSAWDKPNRICLQTTKFWASSKQSRRLKLGIQP